jgi:DNA-binding beta-propeller fold protein YncE
MLLAGALLAAPGQNAFSGQHTGARAAGSSGAWQVLGSARSLPIFYHPAGVAVDPRGNVYVTDSDNTRVLELSPAGRLLGRWSTGISSPFPERGSACLGGCGSPTNPNLALDRGGNLYVPDGNCLLKFSSSGRPLGWPGRRRLCLGRWNRDGSLLAAVGGRGNIFVVPRATTPNDLSYGSHIVKVSPTGRVLADWQVLGPTGASDTAISGLAVDGLGNLYAVVHWTAPCTTLYLAEGCHQSIEDYSIDKLSPSGKRLARWQPAQGEEPWIFLESTYRVTMAVDQRGAVYVGSYLKMVKLSPAGRVLARWGGLNPWYGLTVSGIAVGPRGSLFVGDSLNNRIYKLSSTLTQLARWGANGPGPGQFADATAVGIGPHGSLYVVDTENSRIVELSPGHRPRTIWTHRFFGRSLGQRVQMAVGGQGTLFVADGFALYKLSPTGELLGTWKDPSVEPDFFGLRGPWSVAVGRDGTIYLAGYNDIVELSPAFDVRARFPLRVFSLAVDASGSIYAVGFGTRFTKLSPDGRILARWDWAPTDGAVAVDRRNNVYASDTEQDRIVKFSPTGHVLARWGEPGTDTGQFHLPYGIAVDARGNL